MPYGMPWETVAQYRCVRCKNQYGLHRPYCCFCGAKRPDEEEARKQGLLITSPLSDAQSTRDIPTINAFLRAHHGKPIRLWDYQLSHCELELRVRHSGGPNQPDWHNTLLYCSMTEFIQAPTLGWESALEIREEETERGHLYILLDEPANVRIECRMLTCYFDVEPGY
jgi:hypothetical protein